MRCELDGKSRWCSMCGKWNSIKLITIVNLVGAYYLWTISVIWLVLQPERIVYSAGFFSIFTAGISLSLANCALLNVTQAKHLRLAIQIYYLVMINLLDIVYATKASGMRSQ